MQRREFLFSAAAAAGLALTGWKGTRQSRSNTALRAAGDFLASRQAADGAWRSARSGALRDGDALTPLVLWAWPGALQTGWEPMARGLRWLQTLTAAQAGRAEPWTGLAYPLFTAGYAAQVFARTGDRPRAAFWADLVERLQISTDLGWPNDAPGWGAWGDAPTPPHRPSGDVPPDLLAPNISATVLGLQALCAAGRTSRTRAARRFLHDCQNFTTGPATLLDDGGFCFAPGDAVRNKAGLAGRDATGREHFRSYGSATCDGLLALRASSVAADDPRATAARAWLRVRTDGLRPTGDWPLARAHAAEALTYYQAQALAAVLCGPDQEPWMAGQRLRLAADLLTRQDAAGAWAGSCPDSFEDDPLLATAFAVRAFALLVES